MRILRAVAFLPSLLLVATAGWCEDFITYHPPASASHSTGDFTVGGQLILPDGSLSAPSLAFADETAMGLIRSAAGVISLARSGQNKISFGLGTQDIQLQSDGALGWTASATNSSTAPDTLLYRDAANTLALRNSTNAQTFNIYNTYTDGSNYERAGLRWSSNAFLIGPQAAGTGTSRTLVLATNQTGNASLGSELVTNGTFDSDASGWTATNWTWGSGKVTHDTGNVSALSQSISVTSGQTYHFTWTSADRTAGTYTVALGAVTVLASQSGNTTYNVTAVAGATGSVSLSFTPSSDFDGSIDTVSVKRVTASSAGYAVYDSTGTAFSEHRGNAALFNDGFGVGALRSNTTGANNAAQGAYALYSNTTGSYNAAQGTFALRLNTTGTNNAAQGYGALYSNTTGTNNSAQGTFALYSNISGSYNTAQGFYALYSNTGSNNTAQGRSALYSNTTGTNNSAQGANSLYSNTTGYENSAQGANSLRSNTTGSSNSAQGVNAGYKSGATPAAANAVTTGTRLTFVGFQSGLGSATQRTNSTAIGAEAYVDADNTVALGDENITQVLMGSASQANVRLGGSIQGSKTKALSEGSATTVVTVAVPQTAGSNFAAGEFGYTVYATDGTDTQTLNGSAFFSAVNKAGTETCTLTDDQIGTEAASAGTLACTVTCVTGLTDVVGLALDCTSSLTQTTLNGLYRLDMQQSNTVAPQ